MRIYELLSQSFQQQLDQLDNQQPPGNNPDPSAEQEDDSQGKFDANKVQDNLQDVAAQASDQNAQPEPVGGTSDQQPSLDHSNVKPIDSALLGQIKNLPFATKYQFDDNAPLNPLNIAAMSLADLMNLKNMVRFKIQQRSMQDRVGQDDDIDMQFYSDLLKFINTVNKFKKSNTSAQLAQIRPGPSYQNLQGSK
jgi:hypothetical protein